MNSEPLDPDKRFIDALNQELQSVKDHGFVLILTSIIEDLLKQAIERRLLPSPKENKDMLFDGPNSPLGSLSSRITVAYRTGVINKQMYDNLHRVRRIRNKFAHEFETSHLGSDTVNDLVKAIDSDFGGGNQQAAAMFSQLIDFWKQKGKETPNNKGNWISFRVNAMIIIGALLNIRNNIDPLSMN